MDGAELGESRECSSFQDACETLAIGKFSEPISKYFIFSLKIRRKKRNTWKFLFYFTDDEAAPLRYNRRCARNLSHQEGCIEANIQTPDGNTYPGRVCFCDTDDCNDIV